MIYKRMLFYFFFLRIINIYLFQTINSKYYILEIKKLKSSTIIFSSFINQNIYYLKSLKSQNVKKIK